MIEKFKVIFIGDAGVGKTKVIERYSTGNFTEFHQSTIAASNITQFVKLNNQTVELDIWDTAGQETYRSLVPVYCRNAALAVLEFAIDDPKTFQSLDEWYSLLRVDRGLECPIIVVGNKYDLYNNQIELDTIEEWVNSHHCHLHYTSALDGTGITDLFLDIAQTLINEFHNLEDKYSSPKLTENGKSNCNC